MSKQIYEELLDAGAPELPAGFYYLIDDKVTASEYKFGVRVRVRKSNRRWFDWTRGEAQARDWRGEPDGVVFDIVQIVHLCAVAHGHAFPTPIPDRLAEARRFMGRHP